MKTTFSYFPGMFENPAPAKYYFQKNKIRTHSSWKILKDFNGLQNRGDNGDKDIFMFKSVLNSFVK